MSKQDRQGVRTPAALEQKYDFGQIADASKAAAKHSAEIAQLGRDIARQGEITDKAIAELEQQIESKTEAITAAQSTADRALTTATSAASVAADVRRELDDIDVVVKNVMTDGTVWTEAEQTASRAKIGAASVDEVLAALPVYNGEVVAV